jgi:plastocyanin
VDSGQADLMRFIRTNTVVKVNSWVTFTNTTMDPHTVTIGAEDDMPFGGLIQFGDQSNVQLGENVSSGLFGAAFTGFGLPTSVQFRFTQPGVYHYFCIFHDYEGMVGTITVVK